MRNVGSARRRLLGALGGLLWLAVSPRAAAQGAPDESPEARARKQEERLSAAEARLQKQDEQLAKLLAGLERQGEEVKRLRSALEAAKAAPPPPKEPEPSPFRLSGFVEADWALHRQSSQDEVSSSNGEPLNQDRFLLRR